MNCFSSAFSFFFEVALTTTTTSIVTIFIIITMDMIKDYYKKFQRIHSFLMHTECPRAVGWEKNERHKLGARMVDLSATMDPCK